MNAVGVIKKRFLLPQEWSDGERRCQFAELSPPPNYRIAESAKLPSPIRQISKIASESAAKLSPTPKAKSANKLLADSAEDSPLRY